MTHIADNLSFTRAIADVDLRLVDALWEIQFRAAHDFRPSDRHTIRQGFAAVERIGHRLVSSVGGQMGLGCRVLPAMSQTTRVRAAPRQVWLEIARRDAAPDAPGPVLFCAFAPKGVEIGVFVPGGAGERARKDLWTRFRKNAPKIFRGLRQPRKAPPVPIGESVVPPGAWALGTACPPDAAPPAYLDALPDVTGDMAAPMEAVSIALTVPAAELSMERLEMCVARALNVFAPFLEPAGASPAQRGVPGQLKLVSAAKPPKRA